MFYPTDLHVVANSLGERYECDICEKRLVRKKEVCPCHDRNDKSESNVTYHHTYDGKLGGCAKISSPLIAVRRPPKSKSKSKSKSKPSTSVSAQTIQDNFSKAVSSSPLFGLPVEIRHMIWKLILVSDAAEIDVLPLRLCPHVDALELRICKEGGNNMCLAQDHSWCCHCACTRRRNDRGIPTQYDGGNLLNVCRMLQLEVLRIILHTHKIHLNDAPELPDNLNEPSENAMPSKETMDFLHKYGDATPGGLDRLNTFQPFCALVKSMQITTFVDTDCVDIQEFRKKTTDLNSKGQVKRVARYYRGTMPAPRLAPETVLSSRPFRSIFSGLRELHVRIAPQPSDDQTRELPRYLVRQEFIANFHSLSGLQLSSGTVAFVDDFAARDTSGMPPPQSIAQTIEEVEQENRRTFGRRVTKQFLKMIAKTAEKTMMKHS